MYVASQGSVSPALLRAVGASPEAAELFAPLLDNARYQPGDSFLTISSKPGVAMLVAQLAHESNLFSTLSENLNYSVQALQEGNRAHYFSPNDAAAYGYVKSAAGVLLHKSDPRMIANLYYGSRMGNRGTNTDDGWTFRGAGLIQLTGRDNFTRFGQAIGKSPEEAAAYARTPQGAVAGALWFWRSNNLLVPASKGDVETCTRIINGGLTGLASRNALYKTALVTLG